MSWLSLLGIAVVLTLLAALSGIKPSGTRQIANTRLMGAARAVLFGLAAVCALMAGLDFLAS